ncbi:MAG TPA: FHA domain-containing protein [Egibacteraceae bacterium]|nr:FHA domain-containing protein [Egibacteraceae bacterium]
MPPIIHTLLQGMFLLLLYVFVARAVRAVARDMMTAPAAHPRARRVPARMAQRQRPTRSRSRPRELVVHSPGERPIVLPLDGEDITFGREDSATVALRDPYISELHAKVHQDGDQWLVTDMGSTNGTFLNQVKVGSPMPIAAGDQVTLGKTVVEVRK